MVLCSIRLGDTKTAKEAISLLNKVGEIRGLSSLCQGMISGVKVQNQTLDQIDRLEESAMGSMKS